MTTFLNTRKGDKRTNILTDVNDLYNGDIFYITCIDEKEKLKPFYDKYKEKYHCVYDLDIYSKEQWLEIMPVTTSKSYAISQLKEFLECDRLVVFGDGKNDVDMFEMADEAYAVENAVDDLKKIATKTIGGNNEDGVAKWLEKNVK